MAIKARLSADDLWRMGEDDIRRELVNGEVIEMVPSGGIHGKLAAKVCKVLTDYVATHRSGEVVVGDVGFVLNLRVDPERVRAPDVAYISAERLPEGGLPQGFIRNAPDLAVEILSSSETSEQIQQKVRDYLEAGVRLVWIVAPEAKTVTVYRADGSARLLRDREFLEGEDVLSGLRIGLPDLFE